MSYALHVSRQMPVFKALENAIQYIRDTCKYV